MATKKQKRLAALEKREAFEAELKRTGLDALRKDRRKRTEQAERAKEDAAKQNRKTNTKLKQLIALTQQIEDSSSLEMECR